MGAIRFGPARVPSRERPAAAVELLVEQQGVVLNQKHSAGIVKRFPEPSVRAFQEARVRLLHCRFETMVGRLGE